MRGASHVSPKEPQPPLIKTTLHIWRSASLISLIITSYDTPSFEPLPYHIPLS